MKIKDLADIAAVRRALLQAWLVDNKKWDRPEKKPKVTKS